MNLVFAVYNQHPQGFTARQMIAHQLGTTFIIQKLAENAISLTPRIITGCLKSTIVSVAGDGAPSQPTPLHIEKFWLRQWFVLHAVRAD